MKTILSLRRHHYLNRVAIFLIAIALVVGMVGYGGTCEPGQYDLTIDSTAGGDVTTPGEGTHTYDDGTVVDLVATPDCGHAFVNWTGDTGTIDNVTAAATNITMNANYSITANFEPVPLDHFRCYWTELGPYLGEDVELEDQFGALNATVGEAEFFANPVEKMHGPDTTPISDPNNHLTFYRLYYAGDYMMQQVEVSNQFGTHNLSLKGPYYLAVPTQKLEPGLEDPECLDHYLVYHVENIVEMATSVNLKDQFGTDQGVGVFSPGFFANPVKKTHDGVVTDIIDPDDHLVFYWTDVTDAYTQIDVHNQFDDPDPQVLNVQNAELLAVPSQKIVPPAPPLDHFKCYTVTGGTSLGVTLDLVEDQFVYLEDVAEVLEPTMFCNPVKKNTEPIVNEDNHLTVYAISAPPQTWEVWVDNQFGDGQWLLVTGPVALAVQTQKVEPGGHGLPKYLDHYLLYTVLDSGPVNVTVNLDDQFPGTASDVTVGYPVYFANPALKGYVDHIMAPWNPDEHLVFYDISGNPEFLSPVVVNNQFKEGLTLNLEQPIQRLAVPSVKVSYVLVPPP